MFLCEMRHEVMPGAFNASSPADHSVEAAKVPTLPTQDVLPKAIPLGCQLRMMDMMAWKDMRLFGPALGRG